MLELNENTFTSTIEQDTVTVVDVWTSWCKPCHKMLPELLKAERQLPEITFTKLDAEEYRTIAQQYKVSSIPCCLVFRDGQNIGRIIGARTADNFIEELSKLI